MKFGAHLPLIDFEGTGWRPGDLDAYAATARDAGFSALSANDHFVFQKPWLDCIVALASVVGQSGDMMLATTVALPVVRHPVALAKHAAALDILSGGRLVLGVGPGSSARDYALTGIDFDERWKRLDESILLLRHHLKKEQPAHEGAYYRSTDRLEPPPGHDVPIWIGSWGSEAGMRRVARLGDGWLASAYNTTAEAVQTMRPALDEALRKAGKDPTAFPRSLATMWTYVTEDRAVQEARLSMLASMLNRPVDVLASQVLVGPPDECAAKVRAFESAGVGLTFIWPLADETSQLERFARDVAPLVTA